MNDQRQTTRTTKNGSSKTPTSKETNKTDSKPTPFDTAAKKEAEETLITFENKISHALLKHEEVVETSKDIMDYFTPNGMGDAKYFMYKGIKVCPYGDAEEVSNEVGIQAHKRKPA